MTGSGVSAIALVKNEAPIDSDCSSPKLSNDTVSGPTARGCCAPALLILAIDPDAWSSGKLSSDELEDCVGEASSSLSGMVMAVISGYRETAPAMSVFSSTFCGPFPLSRPAGGATPFSNMFLNMSTSNAGPAALLSSASSISSLFVYLSSVDAKILANGLAGACTLVCAASIGCCKGSLFSEFLLVLITASSRSESAVSVESDSPPSSVLSAITSAGNGGEGGKPKEDFRDCSSGECGGVLMTTFFFFFFLLEDWL